MKKLSEHPSKRVSESHSPSMDNSIIELQKDLNAMRSDIEELKNALHIIIQNTDAKEDEKVNDHSKKKAQKSWESLFMTILGLIIGGFLLKLLHG